jgi:hypothetical protein
MSNQKINERKQPTPSGIPFITLFAFCLVMLPANKSLISFAPVVLNLDALFSIYGSALFLPAIPVLLLVIAELLYKAFWRSLLFSIGSVALIAEWLVTIGHLKSVPAITFLSSLPFLIFVLFWNARSLNFMLRLEKRWTSLP